MLKKIFDFLKRKNSIKNSEDTIIISMTSYHKRFNVVQKTLESLFQQKTDIKYEVHIYLSEEDINIFGGMPTNIERFIKKGLKVFVEQENLLSFKKYFYALQKNPHKTIITVDDDMLYPDNWLQSLVECSRKHTNCIVCFRGHYFDFNEDGTLKRYVDFSNKTEDNPRRTTPSFLLLPTGVSGVLYPPESLDIKTALDKEAFLNICPHGDDIWLKLSSLKKNTLCVQVLDKNIHFQSTLEKGAEELYKTNMLEGGNDRQFKKCFESYPKIYLQLLNYFTSDSSS